MIHFINYFLMRSFGEFVSLLPRPMVIFLGKMGGSVLYYLHREFRKKAMTSLYIAFFQKRKEEELKKIAKQSFQNLAITCLEFISLKRDKKRLSSYFYFENGEDVLELLKKNQGIVFLSAHQANWEIPFLAITSLHFQGIAIGRPIKNKFLYKWVLSVRESVGGKIVSPKNAIKEGVKALNEGKFMGIVGDQAFPEGQYTYPLFGTPAWTSTTPALLAYRTNSPIVVVKTRREGVKYAISSSPPLWPDCTKSLKDEIPRLMDQAMNHLEKSIEKTPSEWLWQHDRWKQHKIDHIKRNFRYAFILVILPFNAAPLLSILPLFKEIYPRGFLTLLVPKETEIQLSDVTILKYEKKSDLFLRDFRFQIVFDFYNCAKLRFHFRRLGAFKTLNLKMLEKIAEEKNDLEKILLKAICKSDAKRPFFY
jgi:Kdo2-lipid IVA lauroyltransferase/acyltransferase